MLESNKVDEKQTKGYSKQFQFKIFLLVKLLNMLCKVAASSNKYHYILVIFCFI
jgi:hypothetical protein